MRKRITITIKDSALKEADKHIDGMMIRSRSQAIEYLISKYSKMYEISGALILAGGKKVINGTPKCMVLVKKKPVLEHIVNHLKSFGINRIIIYVDHLGEKIMNYFGDGGKFGVSIGYIVGKEPCGQALPIKMAKDHFNETFLVYYGDTLCKIDVDELIRTHKDNHALATVALTTVSNPKDYGVVQMKGNKITDFIEKPKKDVRSHLISTGIFLVEPEIIKYIRSSMYSLEKELFQRLAKKGLLIGYIFDGLWLNINDKNTLKKANNLWA